MTVFLPLFETTDKLLPVQIGRRSFQAHTLESRIPPTPSETSSVIWVPCRKREALEVLWSDRIWIWSPTPTCELGVADAS
eukprot:g14165.t1